MAEDSPTSLIYQLTGCPADQMATEVAQVDLMAAQLLLADALAIQERGPTLQLVGQDGARPARRLRSLAPTGYSLPATQ